MRLRATQGAAALALLSAALLLLLPGSVWVVRLPLGLLLIAFLPGYAALAALRPARDLEPAERGMLAVGLSLVITIALTLAAAAAGLRLGATLWTLGGAGATLVGAIAAGTHPTPRPLSPAVPSLRPATVLFVVVTVAVLAGAATIGTRPQPLPADVRGTVALWVLPSSGHRITLGVQNEQRGTRSYIVRVVRGAGRPRVLRTPALTPGASWRRTIAAPRDGTTITATLADQERPARALRRVRITPGASPPIRTATGP